MDITATFFSLRPNAEFTGAYNPYSLATIAAGYIGNDMPTQVEMDAEWLIIEPKLIADGANEIIDRELVAIDLKSIRSLREYVAAQTDAPQIIKDHEAEAISKRSERQ